jgi:uncharacterized protein YndB with AHSA1/START domain
MTDTQSIRMEYDLPHPPAKVWRALTDPELVAKWLLPNDLRADVGHAFKFKAAEPTPWWDGIVDCEVLAVELHKRLQYTWKGGPKKLQIDTVVTWTLTPTGAGGTKLAMEHSGFLASNKFAYDGAIQGWQGMLGGKLPRVLEEMG